jgi:hypothetical protein
LLPQHRLASDNGDFLEGVGNVKVKKLVKVV